MNAFYLFPRFISQDVASSDKLTGQTPQTSSEIRSPLPLDLVHVKKPARLNAASKSVMCQSI